MDENKYIIWFKLSNGNSYYIGKNFKFLPFEKTITFDELVNTARHYTYLGSKRMHKLLWDKYNRRIEQDFNSHIVRSSCYPIREIKSTLTYYIDNEIYFNSL